MMFRRPFPLDSESALCAALRCATPRCESRASVIVAGEGGLCATCALLTLEYDDRERAAVPEDGEPLDRESIPVESEAGISHCAGAADEAERAHVQQVEPLGAMPLTGRRNEEIDVEESVTSLCGPRRADAGRVVVARFTPRPLLPQSLHAVPRSGLDGLPHRIDRGVSPVEATGGPLWKEVLVLGVAALTVTPWLGWRWTAALAVSAAATLALAARWPRTEQEQPESSKSSVAPFVASVGKA